MQTTAESENDENEKTDQSQAERSKEQKRIEAEERNRIYRERKAIKDRLSPIEKMIEKDEKRKEEIDLRNKAEGFIAQIDGMLEDNKDKIDPKQAEETKKLRDDLQKSLDENNMEEVKAKLDMLEKAAMQAGQAMYNQPNSDAASQSTQTHSGDDVVDGEFTEK